MTTQPIDVRCDLCESPYRPTWVFRVHEFAIGTANDDGTDPQEARRFEEGDEWAVCAKCKIDIEHDDQEMILMRREGQAVLWYGAGLTSVELRGLLRTVAVVVLAFLSCRDKEWPGRPFTTVDYDQALTTVRQFGGRGHG